MEPFTGLRGLIWEWRAGLWPLVKPARSRSRMDISCLRIVRSFFLLSIFASCLLTTDQITHSESNKIVILATTRANFRHFPHSRSNWGKFETVSELLQKLAGRFGSEKVAINCKNIWVYINGWKSMRNPWYRVVPTSRLQLLFSCTSAQLGIFTSWHRIYSQVWLDNPV